MKKRSGVGRPYRPRYCSCGAEAVYAVQVLARNVGLGSTANRTFKLGTATLVCDRCSCELGALAQTALEVLAAVRSR